MTPPFDATAPALTIDLAVNFVAARAFSDLLATKFPRAGGIRFSVSCA